MEPVITKKDIVKIAIEAVHNRVADYLGNNSYNSPLNKYIDEALNEKADLIKKIVNDCLQNTLGNAEFKKVVKEEFTHKVAKAMVGKLEGTVEKAVEALRRDTSVKARMVIAIENIINENNGKQD